MALRERVVIFAAALLGLVSTACQGHVLDESRRADGPGGPGAGSPSAPGPGTGGSGAGPADCQPPPQRYWKLTPDQLARTLAAVGVPSAGIAERLKPFEPPAKLFSNSSRQLAWSANYYAQIFKLTKELAATLAGEAGGVTPCLTATAPDSACLSSAFASLGQRAWRRPLTSEELAELLAFHAVQSAAFDAQTALRAVFQRILAAPDLLHRTELGQLKDGKLELTQYELASQLSYFLADGPPDAELLAAADTGALTSEQVRKQAARLLGSAELAPGLLKLFDEYLQSALVSTRSPDVPNRDAVLRSMSEEPSRFVREVLWNDDGTLETLLSAPYTVVDGALAAHYGVAAAGSGWTRATPPDRPGGLLGQSSLLTARRTATPRGRFIRERLLCQPTPAPPTNVDTNLEQQQQMLAEGGESLSPRQVRERHMADPSCSGCHALIDPLGFPFDAYDAAGRYQPTLPDGSAIPTAGSITGCSP